MASGSTNGSSEKVARFGVFELDPRAGELRKHGVKLRVRGKPLQILQVLIEKPGEIVSREELQRRLWSSDVFVDFDSGLNTAANRLRIALGDSAEKPRYIATLARTGYRFIAPVQFVDAEPKAAASRSTPRTLVAAVAVALLLVGAAAWFALHRST